jgi:Na+-translocating ferredoxin:NAD+ oxidoreductase RnfA subunit
MLTMTVYAKLKDVPVDEDAIPAPFRGLPIALLTAGMMVLAFLALSFNVG